MDFNLSPWAFRSGIAGRGFCGFDLASDFGGVGKLPDGFDRLPTEISRAWFTSALISIPFTPLLPVDGVATGGVGGGGGLATGSGFGGGGATGAG